MWPFKKKRGITMAPGETAELNIPVQWRHDRDEAIIMTDDGPILLNKKSRYFLEIEGNNINPIKLQVVPDFKNKELNFIEVVDPDTKFDKNGPRIMFSGSNKKKINFSFDEYIKRYDQNVEKYDKMMKKYKFTRIVLISASILVMFLNIYRFVTLTDNFRYVNLFLSFLMMYIIYSSWSSYRKLYKNYQEFKEKREKMFEIVKNT